MMVATRRASLSSDNSCYEFLFTQTPSAMAIKWSGSEACFEETEDQLSPGHFENTGSTLFFYVECSYLVIIKPKHCRIY